jgi:uncharacterized protein (DUF2132 family)/predicted kinase
MSEAPPKDPLHGITLEMMLVDLVERHGWPELGARIAIRCFNHEPSVGSSLKFLRRTDWARAAVERLYLAGQAELGRKRKRNQERKARRAHSAAAGAADAQGEPSESATAEQANNTLAPRLLLLCGPAFSGKTSLARALESRGWLRIGTDDLLRQRGLEPGQGLPPERWLEASAAACSLITAAAERGSDVVFDDTLCFRFLRDRYREVGTQAGMAIVLVVLKISPEAIRARVDANRQSSLRQDIDDAVLETHLSTFEWPAAEEPHVQLDAGQSVERHLELLGESQA